MRYLAIVSLLLAVAFGSLATAAQPTNAPAAPKVSQPQGKNEDKRKSEDKPNDGKADDVSLEILIEPSRSQPSVGSGLGIAGEFRNKSKTATLHIKESTTTLTLPPELEGPLYTSPRRPAFFPTEEGTEWKSTIAIPPGRSYRVMWVAGNDRDRPPKGNEDETFLWREGWKQVKEEIRYIFFTPGEYKVFVDARVGVDKAADDAGYLTFTQTAVVKAAAPQFVIMLGAVIGGIVSWLLFPQGQHKTISTVEGPLAIGMKVGWFLYSIVGAALFAAIVTILLARLSESQFLVKITVSDFWGAIAVGFIAQYGGKAWLDKYLQGRPQSRNAPAPTPSPTRTPAATPRPTPTPLPSPSP